MFILRGRTHIKAFEKNVAGFTLYLNFYLRIESTGEFFERNHVIAVFVKFG